MVKLFIAQLYDRRDYVKTMLIVAEENRLQDLRTNMLLIQAKAREYLEETTFQKITNLEDLCKEIRYNIV